MRQIIRKSVLTEKAMKNTANGQYVFQVETTANKLEIKKAVEDMFEVKVKNVRTLIVKPKYSLKYTRKGVLYGKTNLKKKAYVALLPGYSIELVNSGSLED